MQKLSMILYGSTESREKAKCLLADLAEIKREEYTENPWEVALILAKPINEKSLIPLLRQSGIHGFRLIKTQDQRFSRKGSPLSL